MSRQLKYPCRGTSERGRRHTSSRYFLPPGRFATLAHSIAAALYGDNAAGVPNTRLAPKPATVVAAATAAMALATLPVPGMANPQGGTVAAGSATIEQTSVTRVDINQRSDKAIIDWRGFNVGPNEHTNFNQPSGSSVTLNRVGGPGASAIDGRVTANGNVFIVNPQGVVIGRGAEVSVGGLVVTTSDIANEDFMQGRNAFTKPSAHANANVTNRGRIEVDAGGNVVLAGPSVHNEGEIVARLGSVALAGGERFTVDMEGDGLLSFDVGSEVTDAPLDADGNAADALVTNAGRITANGGVVTLSASARNAVVDRVINMSGVIEATAVDVRGGTVVLSGGDNGIVAVSGTIDVSGDGADQTGGQFKLLGEKVGVFAGGNVNTDGGAGGGEVLVGGSYTGQGPEPSASAAFVSPEANVHADALADGDGGTVVVWSEESTRAHGTLSARGGELGGDGGLVETSSKGVLDVAGINAHADAPKGEAGQWLLDPGDISIIDDGPTSTPTTPDGFSSLTVPEGATTIISVSDITTPLNAGTNVRVVAVGEGELSNGDIGVDTAIAKTAGGDAELALVADGNITISSDIVSSAGALNVTLESQSSIVTGGGADKSVSTNGGAFTATAAGDIVLTDTSVVTAGGSVTLRADSDGINGGGVTLPESVSGRPGSVTSGGGSIAMSGETIAIQGGLFSVISAFVDGGGGDVTLSAFDSSGTPAVVPDVVVNGTLNSTAGTLFVNSGIGGNVTVGGPRPATVTELTLDALDLANLGSDFAGLVVGLEGGTGTITLQDLNLGYGVTALANGVGGSTAFNGTLTLQGPFIVNGSGATTVLNGNIITAGQVITINDAIDLQGDSSLQTTGFLSGADFPETGGANITIGGNIANTTIPGQTFNLAFDAGTTGSISGQGLIGINALTAVAGNGISFTGPVAAFSFAATNTGGSIFVTNAANDFTGAVTVAQSGTGNVSISDQNTLQLGASTLGSGLIVLSAASLDLGGALSGTGSLFLRPISAASDILLGGTGAGFALDAAALSQISSDFQSLAIGVSGGTGTITVQDVTFAAPLTLLANGTGGGVVVNGTLRNTGSVTIGGSFATTTLNGDIVTAGQPIEINDSVIVLTDSSLSTTGDAEVGEAAAGANITITGAVDGDTSLLPSLSFNAGTTGQILTQGTFSNLSGLNVLGAAGAQFTGALQVGTFDVTNLAGDLTAANTANDFTGLVSIQQSGASAVSIADANSIQLDASSFGSGTVNLSASAFDLTGVITGTGTLTFAPLTQASNVSFDADSAQAIGSGFQSVTIGVTGGTGAISLTDATFAAPLTLLANGTGGGVVVNGTLRNTGSVTIGGSFATTTLNGDIVTAGQPIAINDSVIVLADSTLSTTGDGEVGVVATGADITVTGAVDGDTSLLPSLSFDAGTTGQILTQGTVSNLSSLNVLGAAGSQFTGALQVASFDVVATSGDVLAANVANDFTDLVGIQYSGTGSVQVADANSMRLDASSFGSGAVTLSAGAFDLTGVIAGTGTLTFAPLTQASNVSFDADSAQAIGSGFQSVSIGVTGGTGTIAVTDATFAAPLTLLANGTGGNVIVNGTLSNTGSVTIEGSGTTTTLNGVIATAGQSITINDAVTVASDAELQTTGDAEVGLVATGADITVTGAVSNGAGGPFFLTLDSGTTGQISLQGSVTGLSDLNVLGAAGAQFVGPVQVGNFDLSNLTGDLLATKYHQRLYRVGECPARGHR